MSEFVKREAWQDGCVFNSHGVVCKDKNQDCERCGWNPNVQQRRLEAAKKKTERRKVT